MKSRILTGAAALLIACAAHAGEAQPMASDPATEARMLSISEELRCLVCQNETLAASRAELADDLRREVRSLIVQGKTDQEIKDYLVSRYGDFVLYRPPMKATTWLLWFGPFALLGGGALALVAYLRKRSNAPTPDALSAGDKAAAAALLDTSSSSRPKDTA